MRVSVSRSKNFPRPTSSSNFLSHLASTRETLFFSLPSYSRKVERSSRGHGEKEASLDLIVASTLVSMSCPLRGWIANLKRALFSYSEGFFPSTLGTTVRTASGVQKRESRRSWLERRDFIRTASLLADYSFSFLKARCGLCRPAPVER